MRSALHYDQDSPAEAIRNHFKDRKGIKDPMFLRGEMANLNPDCILIVAEHFYIYFPFLSSFFKWKNKKNAGFLLFNFLKELRESG